MLTQVPAQQIENWPIERLVEYPCNPRKNDKAVDRMCASIREFKFKIPVLARSDGEVVDGHLRLKAARKIGISEIPVILCDEWTPARVKAFRLMVNRSVTWAEWDEELLALELQEIQEADFDLSLTGFDPGEIDELLALRTTRERTRRRHCRRRLFHEWAICGCLDCTGSYVVTRRTPRLSPGFWVTVSRGCWSPIRRMESSWIPNGATALV
jgi:hypothetical protein